MIAALEALGHPKGGELIFATQIRIQAPTTQSQQSKKSKVQNPKSDWSMCSEFDVGAEGGDQDWAAVAIVARILNVLNAGGEVDSAPDVKRVIGFDSVFATVVQVAVSEKEAESSIGEVSLVIF